MTEEHLRPQSLRAAEAPTLLQASENVNMEMHQLSIALNPSQDVTVEPLQPVETNSLALVPYNTIAPERPGVVEIKNERIDFLYASGPQNVAMTQSTALMPYVAVKKEFQQPQSFNSSSLSREMAMMPSTEPYYPVTVKTENMQHVVVKTENQQQNGDYFPHASHGIPMFAVPPERNMSNVANGHPVFPRVAVKAEFRESPSYLPHQHPDAYYGSNAAGYWNSDVKPVDQPTTATVHHRPEAAPQAPEQPWHLQTARRRSPRYYNPTIYQELNAVTHPTPESVDAVSKRLMSYRHQYMAESQEQMYRQQAWSRQEPSVPWLPRRAGSYQYNPGYWRNMDTMRRRTSKFRPDRRNSMDPMEWLRKHLQSSQDDSIPRNG